jgi:protocatechuate 3,4-dioxygenase beta subunit
MATPDADEPQQTQASNGPGPPAAAARSQGRAPAEPAASRLGKVRELFTGLLSLFPTVITALLTSLVTTAGALFLVFTTSAEDSIADWLERRGYDPTEAVVMGQVLDTEGVTVPGVSVALYDEDVRVKDIPKYLQTAVTDSTGYFEFNDIHAGYYTITAVWNSYKLGQASFSIADGQDEARLRNVILRSDIVFPKDQPLNMGPVTIADDDPQFTEVRPALSDSEPLGATPVADGAPGSSSATNIGGEKVTLRYISKIELEYFPEAARDFGTFTYRVEVEAVASEERLDQIKFVEYVFPNPEFWPDRILCFPQTGLDIQFWTRAQFTLHARVHFLDGSSQDIELFISTGLIGPRGPY